MYLSALNNFFDFVLVEMSNYQCYFWINFYVYLHCLKYQLIN